jgi:hypothetical protein
MPEFPAVSVRTVAALLAAPWLPSIVCAQAGPPFLTNDPGTPGNANWEINLAAAQTLTRATDSYQVPQIDLNYGLGDRIQLTYEIPYLIQNTGGEPRQSGWSNGYPGVKWRFFDQGNDGWRLSVFPQVETGVSAAAQQRGIGGPGPRFLLPVEASTTIGSVDLDLEAGYYFPRRGVDERIIGLVAGHSFSDRFELDAEVYDDRATGAPPRYTLLDVGGRYKLSRGFIALFMVGRSISGTGAGQPEFNGYFGIQILLKDYGRSLASEP